jgi:hypothetical protein
VQLLFFPLYLYGEKQQKVRSRSFSIASPSDNPMVDVKQESDGDTPMKSQRRVVATKLKVASPRHPKRIRTCIRNAYELFECKFISLLPSSQLPHSSCLSAMALIAGRQADDGLGKGAGDDEGLEMLIAGNVDRERTRQCIM